MSITEISQSGQTRALTIAFDAGAGSIASGEYAEVHVRIYKSDWSNYDMTNDYSFGTQSDYQDWQKLTLYFDGAKAWGLEPGEMGLLSVSKFTPTAVVAEPLSAANAYNYPNPVTGNMTNIRFSISKPSDVNLTIYDCNGSLVWRKTISVYATRSGVNVIEWDLMNDRGVDVANGVYLLSITAEGRQVIKKIAVVH